MQVTLSNITKTFGDAVALRDLSIEVRDGEFLVLLGPSGCGKTTALRIIAGLESADSGNVYFDGNIGDDLPPGKRGIAMVFQNYALYPHRTVWGNIAYPLLIQKKTKSEIAEAVQDSAHLLSINHLLRRFPRQLSSGEAQRVALARAMVRKPQCFLFDEPLSNLDTQLRIRTRAELREIHNQRPTTTIYVTHDQEEASILADRIVVLRAGQVMQIGTSHEIYTEPRSLFVAGFIGSPQMNFMQGLVRPKGEYSTLEIAGNRLSLPASFSNSEYRAEVPVTLGIRPEDFEISQCNTKAQVPEDSIQLVGTIRLVQRAEPDTYLHVDVNTRPLIVRFIGEVQFVEGDCCRLLASLDHVHIFEAESGLRFPRMSKEGMS